MQWDYEASQDGINMLEAERMRLGKLLGSYDSEQIRNIEHTIAFIEHNIREGEVLLPEQTYFLEK